MGTENLHPFENMDVNVHAEFVSSPPPADLPEQEIQETNLVDMSGPFEPEMLTNLPLLTIQQLSKLEETLSEEFAALAQQYVTARKSRVEFLQKSVESQIKKFQHNDSSWSTFYNQQAQIIKTLTNVSEDRVIRDNSSSKQLTKLHLEKLLDFEEEFERLVANLELPLDFDDIFQNRLAELPFASYFKEIVDLHKAQLLALLNQLRYLSNLTKSITEKNRILFWKQYREDVMTHKHELIDQTCQELETLHKEYYGISSEADFAQANMHYYRSVVPLDMSKSDSRQNPRRLYSSKNHDKYYDADNRYYRNNRIEITDTKREIQQRINEFVGQQNKYKIPQLQTVTVKLDGCKGLTKEETDADLAVIRLKKNTTMEVERLSDELMYYEDLDISSFSREPSFDSEEEDYYGVLHMGESHS